ncbi:TatD family hydrolase [Prochlorococcus marinus]|uniref:D-aminoacyl-tRNA deacylase n=1 Tax=Prochlorococcus marinus (strain MIT 9211) TaxID=93059 RepID=A9BCH7_PROM4|nr:TatD family hydrolase [Prochlorococcus marinus]ABX09539.1 possible deoxyribonuclease, TatD family [Prochlorococcus marinus str. MIT 9211]
MTRPVLIDSHCHLIFKNFEEDLDEIAERWRAVGVQSLVHACVEASEIPAIRALADRFPELRYSVGVHPLDINSWTDETLEVLRRAALEDSRVVAIGELGLDLFRDSNLDEQLAVLKPQLKLAFELDLPVIIHCRDAAQPMIDLLSELRDLDICPKGVMHCWAGDSQEMQAFLDLGFFISFSGMVTFPKAQKTHLCARKVPEDRFLIETDCPFLSPVPWRGKRNEPAHVEAVAKKIAEIRGKSFLTVANQSTDNAIKLFNLI